MELLKRTKTYLLLLIDMVLINLGYMAAFYFRFTSDIPREHLNHYVDSAIIIVIIYLICFHFFKLYESLWIHASVDEFLLGIGGVVTGNIFSILYGMAIGPRLPYSVSILAGIFNVILVVGFRMSFRIIRRLTIIAGKADMKNFQRVLVVGAGYAGMTIIREMQRNHNMKYLPIGIIDDSRVKKGTSIRGIRVLGDRRDIERLAEELKIEVILIAIPSLCEEDKRDIINICNRTGCKMKIMPGLDEIINQDISLRTMRDVSVEDLLGRDPVKLDMEGISDYLEGKNILVTGGGGSIGSELCRQIARFKPKTLAILDIYENNAYDLQNELKYINPELNLRVYIASVRDKYRLEGIFSEFQPQVVFHAAAHKHVPLMEDNPSEAIKNNIFGTLNVAECADKFGAERFVLISTDKAVNPTNVMGATKRVCEMIIQSIDKRSETEFVAVRFGNVLGSNGSVIPLFKKQIAKGGPVTLTHKDIIRYFMTIPEAAQLVLQAGGYAEGGEIFVLDMGKPVRIYDLAEDLIRLSGFEPHRDIEIKVTGLRPGEKLYEELLMGEEGLGKTKHEKIFIGRPVFTDFDELKMSLEALRFLMMGDDREALIGKLQELVPTYVRKTAEAEVAASAGK